MANAFDAVLRKYKAWENRHPEVKDHLPAPEPWPEEVPPAEAEEPESSAHLGAAPPDMAERGRLLGQFKHRMTRADPSQAKYYGEVFAHVVREFGPSTPATAYAIETEYLLQACEARVAAQAQRTSPLSFKLCHFKGNDGKKWVCWVPKAGS